MAGAEGSLSIAVLAAGSAVRMGGEKVLLEIDGQPLVRRAVSEALALAPAEVLVIANVRNEAAIAGSLGDRRVRVIVNADAARGVGTSIALAAASVAPGSAALLLLQADQPFVDRDMLRRIVDEWRRHAPAFVAASYGGLVTTPVLFARSIFVELTALDGDRGAKAVLRRHAGAGRELEFEEWRGLDVDTPEDYRRACERWRSRPGS